MGAQPSTNNTYVIPNMAEFLARRMRDISARINCHTIGQIVSFDPTTQTAVIDVQFMKVLRAVNPIGDTGQGSDEVVSYPQLVDVPIVIMQGGGGALTFPITAGDICVVLFCDRDMDNWFNAGLKAVPNSNRVHDINDAIAVVGINNLQTPLANYNTQVASLYDSTGERLTQSGMMVAYGGDTAPSGWLLCQGQSLLRASYPLLFTAIGTKFGSADGTHFTLPDMTGRVAVGLKGSAPFASIGTQYGEETHLLTGPESGIQAHNHTVETLTGGSTVGNGGNSNVNPAGVTGTTGPTNAQSAHNNIQPSLTVNWIIKI